jgi:hypothetical protein
METETDLMQKSMWNLEMSLGPRGYRRPHLRVGREVLLNLQLATAEVEPLHGLPVVPADLCCIFRVGEHHLRQETAGGREQQAAE